MAGKSGTGKEVLARFVHKNSPRKDKPFLAINCASIPFNLPGKMGKKPG
ncbi:MAG: sigma 54-interacting transcriptional regulator [Lutispora sp.]|nr:sigma 54-interacting transcriptional regulator [Lutispora sp.]MEA4960917.1 sigma 54-interacting transcriptional regulator [Lutispora sp.]